jgi:hypothetical protein
VRTGGVDNLFHKPSDYRVPLPQCAQDMALSAFSVYSAARRFKSLIGRRQRSVGPTRRTKQRDLR